MNKDQGRLLLFLIGYGQIPFIPNVFTKMDGHFIFAFNR